MRRFVPLSLFWLLYFAGLGVYFPYFSLYLRENVGLSGARLGLIQALPPLVALVAQPLWGIVADRTGERSRVLLVVTAGAATGFALLPCARDFASLALAVVGLALFSSAVVPAAVAVSFATLRDVGAGALGRVRVWGSIGFLLAVVGLPELLDVVAGRSTTVASPGVSEPRLGSIFALAAGLSALAAVAVLALPPSRSLAVRARPGDVARLLGRSSVRRLLLVAFVAFLGAQGPMVVFPVFIRSVGGDLDTVGRMWLVMLLVEIPLVALSGRGLRRIGARGLLMAGVLAAGVRWVICGLGPPRPLLYAVQLVHGVTVTGVLLGGPLYLEAAVPERLRSTAQALYSMCGVGLGGSVSSALAGWLLDAHGAPAPYLIGGTVSLALGAAMPWILPSPSPERDPGEARWGPC